MLGVPLARRRLLIVGQAASLELMSEKLELPPVTRVAEWRYRASVAVAFTGGLAIILSATWLIGKVLVWVWNHISQWI